jgi:glycosyltransferase involved in cell wall biosynthesis
MKVGIYNRWLRTLGGGEKYMLALAACLAREHEVEVITHQAVDLREAAAKLNVDTSRLRLRCLPEMPDESLAPLTAEYDLFILASQSSLIPSRARKSMMMVFFPLPVYLSPSARVRREVGLWLRRELLVPVYGRGFYDVERIGERMARWTDGHAILRVPVPSGKARMSLWVGAPGAQAPTQVTFKLNGQPLAQADLPESGSYVPFQIDLRAGDSATATVELICHARDEIFGSGDSRPVGVAVGDVLIHHWRYRLYRLLFEQLFQEWGLRLHGIPDRLVIEALDTYPLICAISQFTREWIQRYWARESEILYPPVDVEMFQPREKRNIILTVGRIFAGSHNKKHLPMIETFKQLVDEGLPGWEFHITGSLSPEPVHQDYYRRVVAAAQGYPIYVHPDAPLPELQALYGAARIYWHASGYGEDEQREPIKFEHFGITTVEAMSAGAVPVVIGKAGQLEVVEHNCSGLHWQTLDELAAFTRQVISDEVLWSRLSQGAQERSRAFSRDAFDQRVRQIIGDLTGPPRQ